MTGTRKWLLPLCAAVLMAGNASAANFTDASGIEGDEPSWQQESAPGGAQKKVALVIGNARYKGTFEPLANPVNDARDMQAKLKGIGFDVDCVTDADRATMYDRIKDFYKRMEGADIALLYYSGHGVESHNENYLIPVQADIRSESDLDGDAVLLNRVVDQSLERIGSGGGNLIVILDACRSNPLAKTRGASRGLAVIDAAPVAGYIIAYSCKPGTSAQDGDGRHSPFTDSLLQHIDDPDTSFTDILQVVRSEVMAATNNMQVPSVSLETSDQLFLNGRKKVTPWHGRADDNPGRSIVYGVIIVLLLVLLVVVVVLFLLLTTSGRHAVSVASEKLGEGVTAGRRRAGEAVQFMQEKLRTAHAQASAGGAQADGLGSAPPGGASGDGQVPAQEVPDAAPASGNAARAPSAENAAASVEPPAVICLGAAPSAEDAAGAFPVTAEDVPAEPLLAPVTEAAPHTAPATAALQAGTAPQPETEPCPASAACPAAGAPPAADTPVLETAPVGDALLVAKTPVTVGQYRAVMGTAHGVPAADDALPMTGVDWYDALSFLNALSEREHLDPVYDLSDRRNVRIDCSKNGWRLPTQKEWCAAAGKLPAARLDDAAWHAGNSADRMHPCAQKVPNAAGLYDMYGLVWEWCNDTLKGSRRALKGGSWDSAGVWCAPRMTEAVVPAYRSDNTGFRGVRNR